MTSEADLLLFCEFIALFGSESEDLLELDCWIILSRGKYIRLLESFWSIITFDTEDIILSCASKNNLFLVTLGALLNSVNIWSNLLALPVASFSIDSLYPLASAINLWALPSALGIMSFA